LTVYNTLSGRHQQSRRTKTANITKDNITSQHIANMSLSAQVISSFVIFAVLVQRLCRRRPYKVCKTVKFFVSICCFGGTFGVGLGIFQWACPTDSD